jgi:hypothetical protein
MFLFTLVLVVIGADHILLRRAHGSGDDRHRDVIECARVEDNPNTMPSAPTASMLNEERLLTPLVLPAALWCDEQMRCHDLTAGHEYRAVSLVCNDTSFVRCVVRIDCTEHITAFWWLFATTVASIIALIVVPILIFDMNHWNTRHQQHLKDHTL